MHFCKSPFSKLWTNPAVLFANSTLFAYHLSVVFADQWNHVYNICPDRHKQLVDKLVNKGIIKFLPLVANIRWIFFADRGTTKASEIWSSSWASRLQKYARCAWTNFEGRGLGWALQRNCPVNYQSCTCWCCYICRLRVHVGLVRVHFELILTL